VNRKQKKYLKKRYIYPKRLMAYLRNEGYSTAAIGRDGYILPLFKYCFYYNGQEIIKYEPILGDVQLDYILRPFKIRNTKWIKDYDIDVEKVCVNETDIFLNWSKIFKLFERFSFPIETKYITFKDGKFFPLIQDPLTLDIVLISPDKTTNKEYDGCFYDKISCNGLEYFDYKYDIQTLNLKDYGVDLKDVRSDFP
jgi:hypothetical protein